MAPEDVLLTGAVAGAATMMYMANTALVTGIVSLEMGVNPARVWWMETKENGPAELSLLAFGFLGAVAYDQSPWSVMVPVIPVAIIYIAFSRLARSNTRLEEALERLEALQGRIVSTSKLASIGAISLDLVHQIKNPLTILLGRMEVLDERLEEQSAERRHVEIGLEAGWRIQELTETFTSIGRRKWVKLDISVVLNDAFGIAALAEPKRIETRWDYVDELPKIEGNPVLLREALSNIFSNAMEAVGDDGLIAIATSQSDGFVVIRILDNGEGISGEALVHLFEPFQSTKPGGRGLGLFAAKHILEMHRGSVDIRSEEGKGTTVTMRLPTILSENGDESPEQDTDTLLAG